MSTRSAIIIKTEDGFAGIYCHSDGYPDHVGAVLDKHYNTPEKAAELISMGDLSSLYEKPNPDPGTPHSFDEPQERVTVAYHRDRGEKFSPPITGTSVFDVAKRIYHNGYVYVFDGKWTCNGLSIPEAIKKDAEQ